MSSTVGEVAAIPVGRVTFAAKGTGNAARSSSTVPGSTAAALPWLVLLGRCALWQAELLLQKPREAVHGYVGVVASCYVASPWCASVVGHSGEQQLTGMGYDMRAWRQQLAAVQKDMYKLIPKSAAGAETAAAGAGTTAAGAGTAAAGAGTASGAVVGQMCQKLQLLGQLLTVFAIPFACNNPSCANVFGPSEQQLVGGRSCVCAGCRTARYCGKACQAQHWKHHKPMCKRLAAAAAQKVEQQGV